MATEISSSFLIALLLCLLCTARTIFAINNERLAPEATHYHSVQVNSLLPSSICNSTSKGSHDDGFLRVTHSHGPCSPLKHGRIKTAPTIVEIFQQDRLRAKFLGGKFFIKNPHLKSNIRFEATAATVPATAASAAIGRINYLASFGIGTPPQEIALELDTGSHLAWTQCKECTSKLCYKQRDPFYDPSKSSTYSAVKCPSPLCSSAGSGTDSRPTCSSSKCLYKNTYEDASYSVGYFSTEKLTLTQSEVLLNFQFGCGINNSNGVNSDGVLGLARRPISIVQQMKKKYGQVFSYCFPSKTSQVGFLKFGVGGVSKHLKYTPLINISEDFYMVTVTAIKLGGKTLPIETRTLINSPTILDSGTVFSFIQPKAYKILRAAFRQEMSDYPRMDLDSVKGELDTCYSLGNHKAFRIPKMSIVFAGGSTVNLATSGVIVPANSTVVCLAYAPNTVLSTSITILGNTLQHTLEVVYDFGNGRVGFGEGACP